MMFKSTFLMLIMVQALHSLEEYAFRLYDVFPPATFVSSLFSSDLQRGFVTFNAGLVAFGFWCYWWPVRRGWPSAVPLAWLWVGIELLNGVGTRSGHWRSGRIRRAWRPRSSCSRSRCGWRNNCAPATRRVSTSTL